MVRDARPRTVVPHLSAVTTRDPDPLDYGIRTDCSDCQFGAATRCGVVGSGQSLALGTAREMLKGVV